MSFSHPIPSAFIWRRVHSLLGLWLVLFVAEHLLVNSQAALWIGNDGHSFVRMVNFIQHVPFVHLVEMLFIGVPLFVHAAWGIKRIFTSKTNSLQLPYERNIAYTWQRISSWVLLIGIIAHVVQMRFLDFPVTAHIDHEERFLVKLKPDEELEALAKRLKTTLYAEVPPEASSFSLHAGEVIASAPDFGTATLLTVRETFKSTLMCVLYTIFVLAAAFHAFNGLWTFLITWGVILSFPSQKSMVKVNIIGMAVLSILGLLAIWS